MPTIIKENHLIKAINKYDIFDVKHSLKYNSECDITEALKRTIRLLSFDNSDEYNNLFDIADLLIKNGAPLATCDVGTSLLDMLIKHHKIHELKDYIKNYTVDETLFLNAVSVACSYRKEDVALMLIKIGKNTYDFKASTILHDCASSGLLRAANEIIKQGIDVNTKTRNGWTPLHYAAHNNQFQMILFLLENGANPNIYSQYNKDIFADIDDVMPIDVLSAIEAPYRDIKPSYDMLKAAMEKTQLDTLINDNSIENTFAF